MEHPTFEELENFLLTGGPPEVAEHAANCEQCQAIVEGLSQVMVVAEQKGITADQLMEESAAKSRQKIDAHLKTKVQKPKKPLWPWLSAAAVIVLIFTFIWLLPTGTNLLDESQEQLAMRHQPPVIARSVTNNEWLNFGKFYRDGDYDQAMSAIELIPENEMNPEKEFFKGLAFIYNSEPDYQLAWGIFQKLSEGENRFTDKATWFQSLCLIQLKRSEEAEPLLRSIVASGAYKAKEAQLLLDLMP